MFWIYGIYNKKHNKIYIGQCKDLDLRMDLHDRKFFSNNYTARFDGKWILIYREEAKNRQEALLREKQLKSKDIPA